MGRLSDLRMYKVVNGVTEPFMVNPYALTEDEIPDFYTTGNSRFKCSCGVLYELRRGDYGLIPVSRKTVLDHKDTCPLSTRYIHNESALRLDPEKGTLVATISGNITKRPSHNISKEAPRKSKKGEHTSLAPSGLIKRINLMSLYYEYEKKRSSVLSGDKEHFFKYYLSERFSKFVYKTASSITIDGYDSGVCGTSFYDDGYDFFYRPFKGVEVSYRDENRDKQTRVFDRRFSLDDLYHLARLSGLKRPELLTGDTEVLFIRLLFSDASPLKVSFSALKAALRHLNSQFTAGEIDFGNYLVAAGWRYPDVDRNGKARLNNMGKPFPIADRLTILNVNRYGVYAETLNEYRLIEMALKMANTSPSLMYYKPFILTDEFYKGRWLPLGVMCSGDMKKDVVIEIFDSVRSFEYMEKSQYQDLDRHIYVTWFPFQESLESVELRLRGLFGAE